MKAVPSSKRKQADETGIVDVIRCGAAEEIYCLEMSTVANVKPTSELRAYRRAEPDDPVGFIEHRGQEVPVYDLPDLLDLAGDEAQPGHYVVVIDHPIQKYGLRVESVSRVIQLTQENVLPLPRPLEHTGHLFRGILDFTRDPKTSSEAVASHHLPGITEPRFIRADRRRAKHQMLLLLNPATLLPGHESKHSTPIPFDSLLKRYAAVASVGRPGSNRQIVMFPAGVIDERQLLIGLSISQIVEISEPLVQVSIPGANPAISGFSHWRNCPVPVLNLQASLGHREAAESADHFLIVRDHNRTSLVGLPVAGRVHSMRLPIEHRPCPLPDPSWEPFVLGAFELEERLLILPRLDALSGLSPQPLSA